MTKKKRRLRLCAAALLLAALAVIYALVLRADFNGQDTSEEEEELTVLAVEREDIRSAQIENSAGTLAFSYDGETWSSADDPDYQCLCGNGQCCKGRAAEPSPDSGGEGLGQRDCGGCRRRE